MIKEENVLNEVKRISKPKKIMKIIELEAMSANYVPYSISKMGESSRRIVGELLAKNYLKFYQDDHYMINDINKLVGTGIIDEESINRIHEGSEYDYREIMISKENVKFRLKRIGDSEKIKEFLQKNINNGAAYIHFAYELGYITRDEAIDILRVRAQNGDVVPPPKILAMEGVELDDFLLEIYQEKYKDEFAEIDFESNPLLNSTIVDIIEHSSFLLDENDIVNNSEESINNFNAQRELLKQILEVFRVTGEFKNLLNSANIKEQEFKKYLSEENRLDKYSKKENETDKECEDRIFNSLISEINQYDFSKKEDKSDFTRIARHIFNKYTKDIQDSEKYLIGSYFDVTIDTDAYNRQIENIVNEIVEFAKYIKNIDTSNINNENKLIKAFNEEGEEKTRANASKLIRGYLFNVNVSNVEVPVSGNINNYKNIIDTKFGELLRKLDRNEDIDTVTKELKNVFFISEDKIKTKKIELLSLARDEYEKIKPGLSNKNTPPEFSVVVKRYLDFLQDNPEGTIEEFSLQESGTEIDCNYSQYKVFYEKLKNAIDALKDNKFSVKPDVVIQSMSKYLERKDKVYNIKHINTKQLFIDNQNMNICRSEKGENKSINIAFDGYMELYGGHYKTGNCEEEIEAYVDKLDETVDKMYTSNIGKVYLPLAKLTEAQKSEFRTISEYIEMIENNISCPESGHIELYNRLKDCYDNKKEKDFLAIKYQSAIGAGLDRYRQVFGIKTINERYLTSREKNQKIKELEKRIEELTRQDDESDKTKDEKIAELEIQNGQKDKRITELERKLQEEIDKNVEVNRMLQEERDSHSLTKKALGEAQKMIKSLFGFVYKVKNSVFGKFFFGKAIKELPEAQINEKENSDGEEK